MDEKGEVHQLQRACRVPQSLQGQRLDRAATLLLADFSRARIQAWIREGAILLNGVKVLPRAPVQENDLIELSAVLKPEGDWAAQEVAIDLLYEDGSLLVLNKPAGVTVHPGAGQPDRTLLNGLLYRWPSLRSVPRAGIVHRLDKDTTGLMVVAKTVEAHANLVAQLQRRTVTREYQAVCYGVMTGGGKVDAPVGRSPRNRLKMAVVPGGKPAITHYRVLQRFLTMTHVGLRLETGRTHQIRVHMAHIRHPLVGDSLYGGRLRIPPGASDTLARVMRGFARQALHAGRLGLIHPVTGKSLVWRAPLPEDLSTLIEQLQREAPDAPR